MASGYASPGSVIAESVVLPVLCIAAVSLRMYTRKRQKQPLLVDDWILVPGLVFTIAMAVCMIVGVHGHGLGYPIPKMKAVEPHKRVFPEFTLAAKIEWIHLFLQPLALGCIKLSVLFFYSRIFAVHKSGPFYYLINTLVGLTILWMLAFFFALLFKCGSNFSQLWSDYAGLRACANGHVILLDEALAISDCVFDVILFVLPLPRIWALRLEWKRRMLVSLVFVIGAMAVIGSIWRLVIFVESSNAINTGNKSIDGLILATKFLFWSMFEAGFAILAVCLPTFNTYLKKMDAMAMIRSVRSMVSLSSLRSGYNRSNDHGADRSSSEENVGFSPSFTKATSSTSDNKSQEKGPEFVTMHGMPEP